MSWRFPARCAKDTAVYEPYEPRRPATPPAIIKFSEMANKLFYVLCMLVLMAGHALAHPCFTVNWFPTKASGAISGTCTSDTVPGGCASPGVWNKTSQDATGITPARPADLIYSVALPDDAGSRHKLYWRPTTSLDAPGLDATACANSLLTPAAARRVARKLQAAAAPPTWKTDGSIVLSYSAAWALLDAGGSQVAGTDGTSASFISALMLSAPSDLPSGTYCWSVNVSATINTNQIVTPDGSTSSGNVTLGSYAATNNYNLAVRPAASYQACFYKRQEQAAANITFGMCRTGALEANLTGVSPSAVPLTLGGSAVTLGTQPAYLLRPLLKVYGNKTRNLDGTPAKEGYDATSQSVNYISKYFLLPEDVTAASTLSVNVSDAVDEGYYTINAVVSVLTNYSSLIALTGLTLVNQSDDAAVYGQYEALARQITNGSEVGVQYNPTTLSAISASPKTAIKTGSNITFTWSFLGVGSTTCWHNGENLGPCTSPKTLVAEGLEDATSKQTFSVVFSDVCGRNKTADYSYTSAGVVTLSKVDVTYLDMGVMSGNVTGGKKNGAGGRVGSLSGSMAKALLAALVLAAVL